MKFSSVTLSNSTFPISTMAFTDNPSITLHRLYEHFEIMTIHTTMLISLSSNPAVYYQNLLFPFIGKLLYIYVCPSM